MFKKVDKFLLQGFSSIVFPCSCQNFDIPPQKHCILIPGKEKEKKKSKQTNKKTCCILGRGKWLEEQKNDE